MTTKSGEKNRILLFFAVIAIGVLLVYPMVKRDPVLKIYMPSDINPKLVDESVFNNDIEHHIEDFELYNQDGEHVTKDTVAG